MLVLSRQRDESIIIGDNIVITVVDIRGDKVRLGIQAPTEIPVHRQGEYEAIPRQSMRAGGLDPDEVPPTARNFPNRPNTRPANRYSLQRFTNGRNGRHQDTSNRFAR